MKVSVVGTVYDKDSVTNTKNLENVADVNLCKQSMGMDLRLDRR